jgi:hypothetical protein
VPHQDESSVLLFSWDKESGGGTPSQTLQKYFKLDQ